MEKAHRQLKVWQEAMVLAKLSYELTNKFPSGETYTLVSQIRRAGDSIPSNIAEGCARKTRRESVQFFTVARGSLAELDTQLELCKKLGLLESSHISLLTSHLNAVDSLLSGLIRYNISKTKKP